MNKKKGIKSFLGVAIVAASLIIGGVLIFAAPEEPKPNKPAVKAKPPTTDLTVKVRLTGPEGLIVVQKTKCPGKQTERCQRLQQLSVADLEIKDGAVCSQQYGGPSIAAVTGTLKGQAVNKTLTVKDGCEIELWNRWAEALGLPESEQGKELN